MLNMIIIPVVRYIFNRLNLFVAIYLNRLLLGVFGSSFLKTILALLFFKSHFSSLPNKNLFSRIFLFDFAHFINYKCWHFLLRQNISIWFLRIFFLFLTLSGLRGVNLTPLYRFLQQLKSIWPRKFKFSSFLTKICPLLKVKSWAFIPTAWALSLNALFYLYKS